MHTNVFADNSVKKKPNTVTYYNSTKCDVDVAEMFYKIWNTQMAYSCFL